MTELRFAGQLTERDYIQVNTLARRGAVPALAALLGSLIAYLLWHWGWSGILADPLWTATVFGPLIVVLPFSLVLRRFLLRRQWRRNSLLHRPMNGVVSDDSLTWNVVGGTSTTLSWNALRRYRDSPALLIIWRQPSEDFLFFFAHYFPDASQWQTFRDIVSRNLPAW